MSGGIVGAGVLRGVARGRPADFVGRDGKPRALREEALRLERCLVSETLIATGWNKAETARRLRIGYPTLPTKIEVFGLTPVRQGGLRSSKDSPFVHPPE